MSLWLPPNGKSLRVFGGDGCSELRGDEDDARAMVHTCFPLVHLLAQLCALATLFQHARASLATGQARNLFAGTLFNG